MTAADSCWRMDLAAPKAEEGLVLGEPENVASALRHALLAGFACHTDSVYPRGLLILNCDFSGTDYSNMRPPLQVI